MRHRSIITVACGVGLLLSLQACSSSSAPAGGGTGTTHAAAGVADRAQFCKGVRMEHAQQSDADELAAFKAMRQGASGSLALAIDRIEGAFSNSGQQDATWRSAVARVESAGLAACGIDLMNQSAGAKSAAPAAPAPSAS